MKEMKKLGVYHGDLKPQNIMIMKNYTVKLIDFGNCGLFEQNHLNKELHKKLKIFKEKLNHAPKNETTGTAPFVSPEIIIDGESNLKSDIWALGIKYLD